MFRRIIKSLINKTPYTIVQKTTLSEFNLLGLKNYNFKTIIDVGANKGQFLENWIKYFPYSKFYCFEPIVEDYNYLLKTSEKYPDQVIAINCALGNREGKISFHKHQHSPSSSILGTTEKCLNQFPQTKEQNDIEILITTLDKFFNKELNKYEKEILLKIDVQGYELEVLKGSTEILGSIKACLLEINFVDLYYGQPSFLDIFNFLLKYNFTFKGLLQENYDKVGNLIYSDVLFIKDD